MILPTENCVTHQIVHPEEVVVDVHVVALEPPDDLPEARQLVHDRPQRRHAPPAPAHHHAPVHLGGRTSTLPNTEKGQFYFEKTVRDNLTRGLNRY